MRLAELRAEVERRSGRDHRAYNRYLEWLYDVEQVGTRQSLEEIKSYAVEMARYHSGKLRQMDSRTISYVLRQDERDAHKAMAFLLRDALREGVE